MINLKLEVIRFSNEDVIATSAMLGPLSGQLGWFFIPTSQYGDGSLGGDYVQFGGRFGDYSGGAYNITNIYDVSGNAQGDRAEIGPDADGYFDETGVPVFLYPTLANVAKETYDAFSYGDGQYYSNGVNYFESYWQ
ncbi:MAG: hypothetical protein IKF53_03525 [Clostridia bacterium]|nr:hypothetical protein [Clostridia bacterium]